MADKSTSCVSTPVACAAVLAGVFDTGCVSLASGLCVILYVLIANEPLAFVLATSKLTVVVVFAVELTDKAGATGNVVADCVVNLLFDKS